MDPATLAITAVGFTLAPAALGVLTARRVGHWALLLGPPVGAALAAVVVWLSPNHLSVHEALWAGGSFSLAAWVAAPHPVRHRLSRGLGFLGFLVFAELLARLAGLTPLDEGPPSARTGPAHWPYACRLDAMLADPSRALDDRMPLVVHLGDSMTQGPRVDAENTFVGRLDTADAGRRHVNFALSGTGPDCALVLLRALPRVDAAFLHIFPANDSGDLFVHQPWCHEDTLIDYRSDQLRTRCPDGPQHLALHRRVAWDPSPYLHRHLARVSGVAAALERQAWQRFPFWIGARPGYPPHEVAMLRARRVVAEIARTATGRGIPLYATLLPWSGLRPTPGYAEELRRATLDWHAALTALHIPVLDLTDALAAHTEPPQPGVYLSDDPPDPHFDALGFGLLDATLGPWALDQLDRAEVPRLPHGSR